MYTSDEIERKAINTMEEYLLNKDLDEALKDFDELRPSDRAQYGSFVEQLALHVLEKSEVARTAVGTLLYQALKSKRVDERALVAGLGAILETADDMAIDVPKIATYLGQILAPLLNADAASPRVEFLREVCEPIASQRICADIVCQMLHAASNRLGHSTVADVFKSSSLRIHDFVAGVEFTADYKLNDFLKEKVHSMT